MGWDLLLQLMGCSWARAAYSAVSRRPAYRKTRRVPRSLRVKGVHPFRRTVSGSISYTPSLGFVIGGLSGSSLTMTFSLSEMRLYLGASSVASNVPSQRTSRTCSTLGA